ncbi:24008_t:CDS:2, partial [Gigaspora rosea]
YAKILFVNKAKISGNFNLSDEEQQSLLFESFKFWIFLLNANGKDHSIQIGLLKTLLESENYELINYFNAGYIDDENFINFINDDTLKLLRNKSNELSDIIEQLISFYNKYYDKTND